MKPVKPVSQYHEDKYPPTEEEGISRRGFVRVVLSGVGATVVGAAVGATAWNEKAEARGPNRLPGVPRRPKHRATINLKPHHKLRGCRSAVSGVTASTYDYNLAIFLRSQKERAGIQRVIVRLLRKHTCKDVQNAKRLRKLNQKIAAALSYRYSTRTGRTARQVWIDLRVIPAGTS